MIFKKLTGPQQKNIHTQRVMLSVYLECDLLNLIDAALKGDLQAAQDFQQQVQFAPMEMKVRMMAKLDEANGKKFSNNI